MRKRLSCRLARHSERTTGVAGDPRRFARRRGWHRFPRRATASLSCGRPSRAVRWSCCCGAHGCGWRRCRSLLGMQGSTGCGAGRTPCSRRATVPTGSRRLSGRSPAVLGARKGCNDRRLRSLTTWPRWRGTWRGWASLASPVAPPLVVRIGPAQPSSYDGSNEDPFRSSRPLTGSL